jgi:nucleoside-diphosphate-sugar epimerase
MAFSEEHGPINLGNDSERTLLSLVEDIIVLTDSASSIEYLPRPVDDPQRRRPDLSLARRLLDWGPKVSFEDGLDTTIRWYAEQRASGSSEEVEPAIRKSLFPGRKFPAFSTPHQGG